MNWGTRIRTHQNSQLVVSKTGFDSQNDAQELLKEAYRRFERVRSAGGSMYNNLKGCGCQGRHRRAKDVVLAADLAKVVSCLREAERAFIEAVNAAADAAAGRMVRCREKRVITLTRLRV